MCASSPVCFLELEMLICSMMPLTSKQLVSLSTSSTSLAQNFKSCVVVQLLAFFEGVAAPVLPAVGVPGSTDCLGCWVASCIHNLKTCSHSIWPSMCLTWLCLAMQVSVRPCAGPTQGSVALWLATLCFHVCSAIFSVQPLHPCNLDHPTQCFHLAAEAA